MKLHEHIQKAIATSHSHPKGIHEEAKNTTGQRSLHPSQVLRNVKVSAPRIKRTPLAPTRKDDLEVRFSHPVASTLRRVHPGAWQPSTMGDEDWSRGLPAGAMEATETKIGMATI